MKNFKNILIIFLIGAISSSCGLVQKVAVSTTSDLLFEASGEIETEHNWELFRDGIPGNLKMMEGLLYLQPKNTNLLAGLTKGYAGYAFAVNETMNIEDEFKGVDFGIHKQQAILNYSKALEYGLRFLQESDVPYSKLQENLNKDGGVFAILDDNLDDDHTSLEAVLFTAQSLGSLIMLQRDNMILVAQLPIVKGLFDWVCSKNPEISFGACDIFYAAYEAARPRALGGNPDKGLEIFKGLLKKYPHNWMARTAYIRYYLIPMGEEEEFNEQMKYLEKVAPELAKFNSWTPNPKTKPEMFSIPKLQLYQAIAIKRYEIIKKYRKSLF